MICLSQVLFNSTCAPGGTGKLPIGASTLTVPAGLVEAGLVAAAGEDAAGLVAAERDVAGLAVVTPAVHAARNRPAAQVVTAMATRQYAFIGYLSVGLVAGNSKT
jgi:hypothetical protein